MSSSPSAPTAFRSGSSPGPARSPRRRSRRPSSRTRRLRVRPVRAGDAGDAELFFRTVMAGFLESENVPDDAIALMRPTAHAERHELFLAFLGDEAVGGGAFASCDGIAFINGSGVRPAFRNRGAQGALLRARLERARELGCAVAYSATFPGTASRRNMERHGFHVAYPKLVMLRPA